MGTVRAVLGIVGIRKRWGIDGADPEVRAHPGDIEVTGKDVTLSRTYLDLDAASGSFVVTAGAVGLVHGRVLDAASASFSVTGSAIGLEHGHVLDAVSGSFGVTGSSVGLERGYVVGAASGTYTVTGIAVDLDADQGSPSFDAELTTEVADVYEAVPTYVRATLGTVTDFDDLVKTAISGEVRFEGARRVENLFTDTTTTLAVSAATTAVNVGIGTFVFSMGAGTGTATFSGTATGSGSSGTLDADASNRSAETLTITGAGTIIVTASVAILATIQLEDVTGQSNQNPSEYVSVGVESTPWHGANVDAVKYFATENGNGVNQFPGSEDLENAAWLDIGSVTVTANDGTDPDGGNTAASLSVGAGDWWWYDDIAHVATGTYTMSCYVKRNTGSDQSFQLFMGNDFSGELTATDTWQQFAFFKTGPTANSGICRFSNQAAELLIWHPLENYGSSAGGYSGLGPNVVAEATGSAIAAATLDNARIERAATNLCLQSEDFSTSWTKGSCTIDVDATTAPSGLDTADRLNVAVSSGQHEAYQAITISASTTYTATVYIKDDGAGFGGICFYAAGGAGWAVVINLSTGAITDTEIGAGTTNTDAVSTSAGNGWWRVSATAQTATTGYIIPFASDSGTPSYTNLRPTYLGVAGEDVFIWGAQLEAGAYPTTYIATSGTAVTRNKDEFEYALTPATNNITFACDWTPREDTSVRKYILFNENDSSNKWLLYYESGTTFEVRKRVAGDNYASSKAVAITIGTTYRLVCRLSSTDGLDIWVDGAIGTPHANTANVPAGSALYIGADDAGLQTAQNIGNIVYYTSALTDGECAAL